MLGHEKAQLVHIKKSQWVSAESQNKEIKDIVESWHFVKPVFKKYKYKVTKTESPASKSENLDIVAPDSSYNLFTMTSSLDDLEGQLGSISKKGWEDNIRFKLVKPVIADKWSGYKMKGINDEGLGTRLIQPGSHRVSLDK